MFGRLMANFADFRADVSEMFASEDASRVVALGAYRGVTKATEKSFEVPFCHVWRLEGSLIAAVRHFSNTAKMQEALQ